MQKTFPLEQTLSNYLSAHKLQTNRKACNPARTLVKALAMSNNENQS